MQMPRRGKPLLGIFFLLIEQEPLYGSFFLPDSEIRQILIKKIVLINLRGKYVENAEKRR
jgi:hypothetical protein